MAFAETAPLIATLDLKGNFASQLKKNQGALGSFSKSLGRAGRGAGQLGAGFARVGTILGTVAVGGLVGAAKAAIDFEDAFAGVVKTVDEADLKSAGLTFETLAQQFRDMATEIPVAATELARIGEAAGALGIKAADIEEFTKTVALLGVTTDLTSDAAAEALGKIGTILDLTGKEFNDFGDILVALGNNGASTESEIIEVTKRFAAAGKQAGLSTPEILAFSSAITSAGVEPEAAGSSLSRLFGNIILETANATKKGKAFAEVTGKSFKDFSNLVKTDTVGAMTQFLDKLNDLDKFEQARALKSVGITNVRDINAIRLLADTYEKNLVPAIQIAENATGALSEEAQKRFNTIASKLTLLKNNFIEAGITIGEGFLPALGRATDKLIAFLKVDANKSALKGIGEDIGKALDSINWDEVLSGVKQLATLLKGALGIAKTLYDSFMLLPGPVKEAAAGFLVLNKLSGGLIGAGAGNLIGGLAATAIRAGGSRLGGAVGAAFAQPVFVTNWAMMAGGGIGGAAGGGKLGLLGAIFPAAAILGIGTLIGEAVVGALGGPTAGTDPGTGRVVGAIGGLEIVMGQNTAALVRLANQRETLGPPTPRGWENRGPEVFGPPAPGTSGGRELRSTFSIDAAIQRGLAAGFKPTRAAAEATVQRNLERLAAANLAATNRVRDAAASGAAASLVTAAAVQNMDRKPPITNVEVNVNVTAAQVNKSVVIQQRFGPSGGSRARGAMPGDSGV